MANQDLLSAVELLKNLLGADAGGKIDELAETLGLSSAAEKNSAPAPPEGQTPPPENAPSLPAPVAGSNMPADLSGLFAGLDGLSGVKNNPHMNLLLALKPYMNPRRASKIDSAMKVIQLAQITRGMGLFGK